MAAVICEQCHQELDEGLMLCPTCLVPVYERPQAGVPLDPDLDVVRPDPVPDGRGPGSAECARAWCGADLPPGATECPECGYPVAGGRGVAPVARAVVRFPGERLVTVLPGRQLDLGRESGDGRVAQWLDDFPDVSRSHARVVVTTDEVTVEDLGSTNGTTLDGTRVHGVVVASTPVVKLVLGRAVMLDLEVHRAEAQP